MVADQATRQMARTIISDRMPFLLIRHPSTERLPMQPQPKTEQPSTRTGAMLACLRLESSPFPHAYWVPNRPCNAVPGASRWYQPVNNWYRQLLFHPTLLRNECYRLTVPRAHSRIHCIAKPVICACLFTTSGSVDPGYSPTTRIQLIWVSPTTWRSSVCSRMAMNTKRGIVPHISGPLQSRSQSRKKRKRGKKWPGMTLSLI